MSHSDTNVYGIAVDSDITICTALDSDIPMRTVNATAERPTISEGQYYFPY